MSVIQHLGEHNFSYKLKEPDNNNKLLWKYNFKSTFITFVFDP